MERLYRGYSSRIFKFGRCLMENKLILLHHGVNRATIFNRQKAYCISNGTELITQLIFLFPVPSLNE
jgi:hypothetical protein